MEEKPTKISISSVEEIKKIMEAEGKIRGTVFRTHAEYVRQKKGEEGLKAVEKETERLGYPIQYETIKEIEWYPIGLIIVSRTAITNTFNWGEKELVEMAEAVPKLSFIVRLFMKYFLFPEKLFRVAVSRMWDRHYTIGSLEAGEFQRTAKKGKAVLRLKNFKIDPLHCFYLGHFFVGVFKLAESRFEKITVKETKCMFRGDDCHEYLIEWTYKQKSSNF